MFLISLAPSFYVLLLVIFFLSCHLSKIQLHFVYILLKYYTKKYTKFIFHTLFVLCYFLIHQMCFKNLMTLLKNIICPVSIEIITSNLNSKCILSLFFLAGAMLFFFQIILIYDSIKKEHVFFLKTSLFAIR